MTAPVIRPDFKPRPRPVEPNTFQPVPLAALAAYHAAKGALARADRTLSGSYATAPSLERFYLELGDALDQINATRAALRDAASRPA